jgi:dTDP-4-amino-4,6-dideoxygalactose transaminase
MKYGSVPFFKPTIGDGEIQEVVATLKSGWLTTGPRAQQFELEFAAAVGARHAVAVNSCTAALHLALDALGLEAGQAVLVPTMTFAATANVVRHMGAIPILVDCLPDTLQIDLQDGAHKLDALRNGKLGPIPADTKTVGVIPVHVGGLMMDMDEVHAFALRHGLWVVEDAAHGFPAAWRRAESEPWRRCGEGTAAVSCFSFYANKTITTGEGGMAVTDSPELATRMRQMSLHGLSNNAWNRYMGTGSWDYTIEAPGFKYNLTDVAAAIGLHQLAQAEAFRRSREAIALSYIERLAAIDAVELPPNPANRKHAWHLFPLKLRLDRLAIDRNMFFEEMRQRGIGCSVHWRPLHLHPYYQHTFRWMPEQLPCATSIFDREISLPLFPSMTPDQVEAVVDAVAETVNVRSSTHEAAV